MVRLRKVFYEESKPTRFFSNLQEKQVSKTLGARKVANSGAGMFQKGDVQSNNILFECKTKTSPSKSITVKKEWFDKNKEEALFSNKDHSVIVFNFEPNGTNYYVLEENDFLLVQDVLNERV